MVSAISSDPSQSNIRALDKVSPEQLYSPGLYVRPEKVLYEPRPVYEEKNGFLKFLGKIILTAVVVGGGAIGIRKTLMNDYKVVEKVAEGAKRGEKFKNMFAKYTDKLYDNTVAKVLAWGKKEKPAQPESGTAEVKGKK